MVRRHPPGSTPVAVGAAALLLVCGALSPGLRAAPLHPDLFETLDPASLDAIPPEPTYPGQDPGLFRVADDYDVITPTGRHWTGHPKVLVLMVDFEDDPALPENDQEHFEELLFSVDTVPRGSLRDYYLAATYGKIDVTGEAFGWYRMPRLHSEYASEFAGLCRGCYPNNGRGLTEDAMRAAIAAGVDFTAFDNDGPDGIPSSGDDDGIIDALLIVHGGKGAERGGHLDIIRSHYWSTTVLVEVDGIQVPDYAMVPEQENVGIAIHEFGHVLGAKDLYDLSGIGGGVGEYSVMAWSMWWGSGAQPGGPDPYTLMRWGVIDPDNPGADEPTLEIPAVRETPYVLRLWTRGEPSDEYFLVENRQIGGLDWLLPGGGLLVYRVDERALVQGRPDRYLVSVLQADGLRTLQGIGPRRFGDAGHFFPGTSGNRHLGADTSPNTRTHAGDETGVELILLGDSAPVMNIAIRVGGPTVQGPTLRFCLDPKDGFFGPPRGESTWFDLTARFENEGSRLKAGTVRFESRDPRVVFETDRLYDVPDIPPLGTIELSEPIRVRLEAATDDLGRPIAVGAEWVGENATLTAIAAAPLEENVAFREDTELETQFVHPVSFNNFGSDWQRTSGEDDVFRGEWSWSVGGGWFEKRTDAVLQFGPYEIGPAAEFRFQHRILTVATADRAFDGGFLEISVDRGRTWEIVDPPGGYPMSFVLTEGNPFPGYGAWAGLKEWEEVVLPLMGMEGVVSLRFHFVSDFTESPIRPSGWFIDDVVLRAWSAAHSGAVSQVSETEDRHRLEVSVVPAFSGAGRVEATLIRESAMEHLVLGRWSGTAIQETVNLEELLPGQVYRYHLEYGDPVVATSPLTLAVPSRTRSLFVQLPSPIRRSGGARVRYRVPGTSPEYVNLTVYDVRGARVGRLVEETRPGGINEFVWAGQTGAGGLLSAGVYFLTLRIAGRTETARVVYLP